jgi:hypothetical protein
MYDSSKNRFFSKVANSQHAQPIFQYSWSQNGVGTGDNGAPTTGIWSPIQATSDGRLLVDIGTGIQISASITGVSVTVDNTVLIAQGQTGIAYQAGISGQLSKGIAITGGQISDSSVVSAVSSGNSLLSTVTGQIATLNTAVASLTGTVSSRWQKVASSGYVSAFAPVVGHCLVSKVQGYSKASPFPAHVLLYDGSTGAGNYPVFSVPTTSGSSWFIDLAEQGVEFASGVSLINSSDAVLNNPYGTNDFFASVVFKSI